MNLIYETERLILQLEHQGAANEVLHFYMRNKAYFEPFEITRPDNFYTLPYHTVSLSFEYNQFIKKQAFRFWIYEKENRLTPIGCVSASNLKRGAFLSCDLAYKIDHDKTNKGYATEACCKMLDIIQRELGFHRVLLHIMPSNKSSLRIADKLGFQYEGMDFSFALISGKWEDHLRYSLVFS